MTSDEQSSPRRLRRVRRTLSSAAVVSLQLLASDTKPSQGGRHEESDSPTRTSSGSQTARSRSGSQMKKKKDAETMTRSSEDVLGRRLSLPSIPEGEGNHGTEFGDPFAGSRLRVRKISSEARNPFDYAYATELARRRSAEEAPPYHVFSRRQKWFVIAVIGAAGFFSGLSSNIYFPALDVISSDLQVSHQMVSLTITSYLAVQGVSPLIWGSISDALGRRPSYIASFAVYIVANIGLSFSPNFAVLFIFRGLQAAGSASTVSIGNGVIQDISPPAERGAFTSFYQGIRNFSIAVGPVLGGVLGNFLGFRSIFVFLLALSSMVTLVIVFFLPETMRAIAGNGSLRLRGVYKPVIRYLRKEPGYMRDPEGPVQRRKITPMTFVEPLRLLAQKDILVNLVFGGVVYTVWSMVTSSTTDLFKKTFHLSEVQIGLAFLPNGFGTIIGSAVAGKLMTRDYLSVEEAYKASHDSGTTERFTGGNLPADFPIERARLKRLPWIVLAFVVTTAAYGMSLNFASLTSRRGWIAVPLVLQFFVAATSNAVFSLNQTLITDLCPGKGAGATAVNNLVRCGMGAVGVALADMFIHTAGPGVTFLGLALATVAVGPLALIHWYWGQSWRASRMEAAEREKTVKALGS